MSEHFPSTNPPTEPPEPTGNRCESGTIRFHDDWPGLFLRGDEAYGYGLALKQFLDGSPDQLDVNVIRALAEALLSVEQVEGQKVTELRHYLECIKKD